MKLEEWGNLILSWANFLDIHEEISSLEELARSDLFSRLLRVLTKSEEDNVHQNDFLDYLQEQYPAIDFGNKQSRGRDDAILRATVFLIYCSLHHEGNDLRQKMTELPHWTQLCLSDFLQELVEVSQSSITRDLIFSEISKISSSRIPESVKQTQQFGTPVIYSSTPTEEGSKTSSSKKTSKLKRLRNEIEILNNFKVELTEELESAKESISKLESIVQKKDQEISKLKSDLIKAENTDHVCKMASSDVSDSRKNKKLMATVDSLEQKMAKLNEELEVTRQERDVAYEEMQKMKNLIQKADIDRKLYDDDRVEFEMKIKELKTELEQLSLTIKEQSEYISELTKPKEDSKRFSDSQNESLILPESLGQQVIDLEIRELKEVIEGKESKINLLEGELQEKINLICNLETNLKESKKEYDSACEEFKNKEKSLLALEQDFRKLECQYLDLVNASHEKDTKILSLQIDLDLLNREMTSLNNTQSALKGELESKNTYIQQLSKDLNDLKIVNNEYLLEKNSLNKLIAKKENDLQQSYYKLDEANTNFQTEVNVLKHKYSNEIQCLKEEIDSAKEMKTRDQESIRKLEAKVKDLKVLKNQISNDLIDCNKKIELMNEAITEKASHILKLESQVTNLSSENSVLLAEKHVLDTKVSDNVQTIKTLESKLYEREYTIKEFEGQLIKQDTEFNSTLDSLQMSLNNLKKEKSELKEEIGSLNINLGIKESELSEAKSQVVSLTNVIENNKTEIGTLTKKIEQKNREIQEKISYYKVLEHEMKINISSLDNDVDQFKSLVSNLEQKNKALKAEVKNVILEKESLLAKTNDIEKELSGYKEKIHSSQSVIRELTDKETILKEQLNKSNEREVSLKAELNSNNNVIFNLRKELDDSVQLRENEISRYKENLNKKETELCELKSQVDSLKEILTEKTSENKKLLDDIEQKNIKINENVIEIELIESNSAARIDSLTNEAERQAGLKAALEREIIDLKNKIKEVEVEHSACKGNIQYSDSVIHELKDKEKILKDLLRQSKETENALVAEVSNQSTVMSNLEEEIKSLKKCISDHEFEEGILNTKVQVKDAEINEIKLKLAEVNKQLKVNEDKFQEEIKSHLEKIHSLDSTIGKLNNQFVKVNRDKELLITELDKKSSIQQEMKSLQSKYDKLQGEYNEIGTDLISKSNEVSRLKLKLKSFEKDIELFKTERHSQSNLLESKDQEIFKLKNTILKLENEVSESKRNEKGLITKISSNNDVICDLEKSIFECKKSYDQAELDIIALKNESETNKKLIEKFTVENNAMKLELEVSLQKQESLKAALETKTKEVKDMRRKLSSFEDEISKLKLKSADEEQTIKSLYQTLQSQNSELKDKDKEITTLQNNIKMFTKDKESKQSCAVRNFRSLTDDNEGKTTSKTFTEEEVHRQIQEVKANCEKKIESFRTTMTKRFPEKLQEMTRSLQNEVTSLREENQKVEDRCASLQSELWATSDKLLIAQEEYRTLVRSLKNRNKFEVIRPCETLSPLSKARSMEVLSGRNRGIDNFARDISFNESPSSSSSRRSSIRSLPKGMGKVFPAAEEDGELFDNRYLADLKAGICNIQTDYDRMSTLRQRNSLCPPHLKSSYPAETQFIMNLKEEELKAGMHPLSASSETDVRKTKTQSSYKKPGPPTPSKNGGRLSLQGNEKMTFATPKSSGRREGVVNDCFVLRESNNQKSSDIPTAGKPTKVSTPIRRLNAFFTNKKDENSPRRRSTFFKRN